MEVPIPPQHKKFNVSCPISQTLSLSSLCILVLMVELEPIHGRCIGVRY